MASPQVPRVVPMGNCGPGRPVAIITNVTIRQSNTRALGGASPGGRGLKHLASIGVGIGVCVVLAVSAMIPAQAKPGPSSEKPPQGPQTNLPPIPAGLPTHFGVGLSNFDVSWITGSGVPWSLRYQYLAGGVNTGDGWAGWNSPPGQFALSYINASRGAGLVPVFIYYQILQSAPNYDEYANLQ